MQQHPHHHSYDPLHLFEGEDEQQMSEAFRNSAFLALSGGFQDAYTYNVRNEVFSNAQTGNVVLMSQHLMAGEWMSGLRYLLPLISFALGVWVAEKIQGKYRYARKLHWRQGVLLAEIVLLFIVGFVPRELDMLATILVSFACAMQVSGFRKFKGIPCATTMCIGNMRSATELLCKYRITKEPELKRRSMHYYFIILVFAAGAAAGAVITGYIGERAIWISAALLLAGFIMMFIKEEMEEKTERSGVV